MGLISALTSFTPGTLAKASEVSGNFTSIRNTMNTYGVFTDVAATISAGHTFTATQTFTPGAGVGFNVTTGGVTVTGNSTITGTLTALTGITSTGTAALADITASGTLGVTGTSTLGATNTGALTSTTFTPSGLAQAGQQSAQKRYNATDSGASITLNWNNGNDQRLRLTANCTITFSNPVAGAWYTVEYQQDGTGSRTISYAGTVTVVYPDGVAPTLTTTASRKDVIVYKCVDATSGGTYLASVFGQNFNNTTA